MIAVRPKILMTMLECGFGHKTPAIAVRDALEDNFPAAFQIDVVDFAKASGAKGSDELLKRSWDFSLAFPPPARIGYLLVEMAGGHKDYLDVLFKDFVVKGMAYIRNYAPDLVFSTHPLCTYIAVKARESLGLAFRLVTYVVDPFDGYSWWAEEGSDYTLVASERSRDRLVSHGVSPGKIKVIGFPINKKFMHIDSDPREMIEHLGLDPSNRTILVSAGGQGIGKVFLYIEALAMLDLPINIITVAGKSARTRKRMDKLVRVSTRTRMASLGYVQNMNELVSAVDAVVGKAGASTAMETIFLEKPMIITEWSTYNDRYIINFMLDYGIGLYCPTLHSFLKEMRAIAEYDKLGICARNLAGLNMKPGTDDVARFLAGQLGS